MTAYVCLKWIVLLYKLIQNVFSRRVYRNEVGSRGTDHFVSHLVVFTWIPVFPRHLRLHSHFLEIPGAAIWTAHQGTRGGETNCCQSTRKMQTGSGVAKHRQRKVHILMTLLDPTLWNGHCSKPATVYNLFHCLYVLICSLIGSIYRLMEQLPFNKCRNLPQTMFLLIRVLPFIHSLFP